MVLVTHNLALAARADRVLELQAGILMPVEDEVLEFGTKHSIG
jgi:predicted ABC-type transport system involved in lysophospholipase L1 biosynthesis ATPase subunit